MLLLSSSRQPDGESAMFAFDYTERYQHSTPNSVGAADSHLRTIIFGLRGEDT
jgi:hypothetical protein